MDFEELRARMNSYTPIEMANKPSYDEANFLPRKFGQRRRKVYTNVQNFDLFFQRHSRFTQHDFHMHNFVEFMFMYEGECLNITDTGEVTIGEGEFCIITPGACHVPFVKGENKLVNFCVGMDFLSGFLANVSDDSALTSYLNSLKNDSLPKYLRVKSGGDREVFECAERLMIAFLEDEWSGSGFEQKCLFNELLLRLIKNRGNDVEESPDSFLANNIESRVFGIIMNSYRTLTLGELSGQLNYSKPYICRIVRQKTGDTFSGVINRLRVRDACHLIRTTDRPIAEIACECGFSGVEYFNRVFRDFCGVSPREFRRTGRMSGRMLNETV